MDPKILWTSYQQEHIEERHSVGLAEFQQAWLDRDDLEEYPHPNGSYWQSFGFTDDGRLLELVWRWNGDAVWPITAYFPEEDYS